MRRLIILVLSIYAGIYSILHASVNKNEAFTLSNGTRYLGHGSHGSHMSHYSGVTYNHYIKIKSSSILNLSEQQITLIKQAILKKNGINIKKSGCSIHGIERCKLLEIDGVKVNKWCYKIYYTVGYLTKKDINNTINIAIDSQYYGYTFNYFYEKGLSIIIAFGACHSLACGTSRSGKPLQF